MKTENVVLNILKNYFAKAFSLKVRKHQYAHKQHGILFFKMNSTYKAIFSIYFIKANVLGTCDVPKVIISYTQKTRNFRLIVCFNQIRNISIVFSYNFYVL